MYDKTKIRAAERLGLAGLLLLVFCYPLAAQSEAPLIRGAVTDRETGQPIANARVFMYGSVYSTVFTNGAGIYTFRASDLSSSNGGPIWGTLYVGTTGYFEARPVAVSDLSTQPSLPVVRDFTLLPSGQLIQGVVRNATTGLGISGALVSFYPNPYSTFQAEGAQRWVLTSADGSYAIDSSFFNESGLTSGFSANMAVSAAGHLGAARGIQFTTYPSVQDFDLQDLPDTLISGMVTDRETGQAIANARVFFYGSAYGAVFTNGAGIYSFGASDFWSSNGPNVPIWGTLYVGTTGYFEAPPVAVSDLSTQTSLPVVRDFTLLPSGQLIQGVVRNATTGLGISGALVSFYPNPYSTFRAEGSQRWVMTSADGSYAIDASFFNESGLSSGFSAHMAVSAASHLGTSRGIQFTTYPSLQDFGLNRPPVSNPGRDQIGIANTPMTFDGTGSFDPDGSVTSYQWDFGDGEAAASGATVVHVYTGEGTYNATLLVTDNQGDTALATVRATVSKALPNQAWTPMGSNVTITLLAALPNGTSAPTVVTFEHVVAAGTATVTTSDSGHPAPAGFRSGVPPVYYEIDTVASFSGSATVCFTWVDGQFARESTLRVFHWQDELWTDVTASVDSIGNTACGQVDSFSPFTLFEAAEAPAQIDVPVLSPGLLGLLGALLALSGVAVLRHRASF